MLAALYRDAIKAADVLELAEFHTYIIPHLGQMLARLSNAKE